MKPQPTMEDVARVSGYSRSAVSLALRGDLTIPAATREKIRAVAEAVGYRVNPYVSALMALRRNRRVVGNPTLAFLTTHDPDSGTRRLEFFRGQLEGVRRRAGQLGFSVEVLDLRAKDARAARIHDVLLTRGIRGIVVAPLPHRETTVDFDFSAFAVVALGLSLRRPAVERVASDHFQSMVLCVRRCVELGYRRLGLVVSQEASHRLEHRWLAAFQFATRHFGVVAVESLMPERKEEIGAQLPRWLKAQRPDVVLLGHVEPEIAARVPARIGRVFLGVDAADSALTGIYQDYTAMGAMAAEQVIAKLYTNSLGPPLRPQTHLIEGIWVPGTTACGVRSRAETRTRAPEPRHMAE